MLRLLSGVAACLLPAGAILAADWDFRPRVELGQSYTNNVGLGEPGREESEWITELRPGLGLTVEAPRATLEADYEMQILRFDDNGNLDEEFNLARALGTIEALPDSGFIDI
ncbi:MAG: hypothetical protein KJP03_00415, partial [Gammaproteobacteria bacterium]|nr:hypothetical protein [Gammaproteobacteria bacterium]